MVGARSTGSPDGPVRVGVRDARRAGGLGCERCHPPILLLYLVALIALEVTSAADARRVAAGDEPLVSSRTLLWGAVALIGGSVLLATFLALPAARGR